jgi:hypothetical protein
MLWVLSELSFVTFFFLYGSTALVDLGRFVSILILFTVGVAPWTVDQPVAKPLRINAH